MGESKYRLTVKGRSVGRAKAYLWMGIIEYEIWKLLKGAKRSMTRNEIYDKVHSHWRSQGLRQLLKNGYVERV